MWKLAVGLEETYTSGLSCSRRAAVSPRAMAALYSALASCFSLTSPMRSLSSSSASKPQTAADSSKGKVYLVSIVSEVGFTFIVSSRKLIAYHKTEQLALQLQGLRGVRRHVRRLKGVQASWGQHSRRGHNLLRDTLLASAFASFRKKCRKQEL